LGAQSSPPLWPRATRTDRIGGWLASVIEDGQVKLTEVGGVSQQLDFDNLRKGSFTSHSNVPRDERSVVSGKPSAIRRTSFHVAIRQPNHSVLRQLRAAASRLLRYAASC
jgi:hypothetical protein